MECSGFFQSHEVIGSSLLFVHDRTNASIWLIDFAKTVGLPESVAIDHNSKWTVGNHEDGYLIGINNMVDIFSELVEQQQQQQSSSSPRTSSSSAGSTATTSTADSPKQSSESDFADALSPPPAVDQINLSGEEGERKTSTPTQQNESNVFRISNTAPSIIKTNSSQQILILDNSHRRGNKDDEEVVREEADEQDKDESQEARN